MIRYSILPCLLFCLSLNAQTIEIKLDTYIQSYVQTNDFSGCVRIVKQDQVLFEKCYGMANHNFSIPNQTNTKFLIGSISKQFTAAAILKLEEEGLLSVEDSLGKYYPALDNTKKSIRIHQLLTHTSGIPDIFNLPDFASLSTQKLNLKELVSLLVKEDLTSPPGTQYQYSNGGFAILADLIEQKSGLSYGAYLDKVLFKPLNMLNTGHFQNQQIVSNLAEGYDPLGIQKLMLCDFIDPNLLLGSGSLYSTIGDVNLWVQSLKSQSLLSKTSYEKLFTNHGNAYGYGISVYRSYDKPVFGHDGRINGFIGDYLHYPEDDLSVIILGNVQTGVADFFRRDIAAILFEKPYQSRAQEYTAAEKYPDRIEEALGAYSFGPNFTVYIERIDGLIKARANQGGYSELVPLTDGRFFSRTLYSIIEFRAGENDKTQHLRWTNNDGNTFEGTKKN